MIRRVNVRVDMMCIIWCLHILRWGCLSWDWNWKFYACLHQRKWGKFLVHLCAAGERNMTGGVLHIGCQASRLSRPLHMPRVHFLQPDVSANSVRNFVICRCICNATTVSSIMRPKQHHFGLLSSSIKSPESGVSRTSLEHLEPPLQGYPHLGLPIPPRNVRCLLNNSAFDGMRTRPSSDPLGCCGPSCRYAITRSRSPNSCCERVWNIITSTSHMPNTSA